MKGIDWLMRRPVALINVLFVFFIGSLFIYQLVRPIDVLDDWRIELAPAKEYRVIDGRRLAVFHPNESVIFTNKYIKTSHASGEISRTLVCEPTTELDEREILLDIVPANKDVGVSPERASSIILPDVVQFNRLPRICKLVIDITYTNVALWRNHTEHAETEPFIVEETQLTPRQMREEIDRLNQQIGELENRLQSVSAVQHTSQPQSVPTPQASQPTPLQPERTITIPENETYIPDTPAPEARERRLIPRILDTTRDTLNGLLGR